MSGRGFHIVVFRVLRPLDPFPRTWWASYLRSCGVVHIVIIFVVRIVAASISHFLVNVAGLSFLGRSRE
jgi:membrane-anchored glycerophosphoryl diester phosphodiesterase (GDPDase)